MATPVINVGRYPPIWQKSVVVTSAPRVWEDVNKMLREGAIELSLNVCVKFRLEYGDDNPG